MTPPTPICVGGFESGGYVQIDGPGGAMAQIGAAHSDNCLLAVSFIHQSLEGKPFVTTTRRKKPLSEFDYKLGLRLRSARISKGMTQSEVASMLGITYQQIQKYEPGESRFRLSDCSKLKDNLSIDFSDIFISDSRVSRASWIDQWTSCEWAEEVSLVLMSLHQNHRKLLMTVAMELQKPSLDDASGG